MSKIKLLSNEVLESKSVSELEKELGKCRKEIVDCSGFDEDDANNLVTNIIRLSQVLKDKQELNKK